METQEIKLTGVLMNVFYLKEFIGACKITFQRLPGGFLREPKDIPASLSKMLGARPPPALPLLTSLARTLNCTSNLMKFVTSSSKRSAEVVSHLVP